MINIDLVSCPNSYFFNFFHNQSEKIDQKTSRNTGVTYLLTYIHQINMLQPIIPRLRNATYTRCKLPNLKLTNNPALPYDESEGYVYSTTDITWPITTNHEYGGIIISYTKPMKAVQPMIKQYIANSKPTILI